MSAVFGRKPKTEKFRPTVRPSEYFSCGGRNRIRSLVGPAGPKERLVGTAVQKQNRTNFRKTVNQKNCKTDKKTNSYVGVINRLDQPVEGIVLFAKNAKTASDLSLQMQNGTMRKFYFAAVFGGMEVPKGVLTDYLQKDGRTNTSKVVLDKTKDAKKRYYNMK